MILPVLYGYDIDDSFCGGENRVWSVREENAEDNV
jgi:hypothetical protein